MSLVSVAILVVISIIAIIILTSTLKLKAFIALFIVSVFLAFTTLPPDTVVNTIKEGFGGTMASIGFLIIFGAMIGITLDKTGATISIANYILSKTGEKRSAQALGITGFITGLPIFCDSGWGRMLAMLSMGAGSMIVSHANDSYFWVISNFAGLDVRTTLRVYSTSTIVMGIVVFACVWISSLFLI